MADRGAKGGAEARRRMADSRADSGWGGGGGAEAGRWRAEGVARGKGGWRMADGG